MSGRLCFYHVLVILPCLWRAGEQCSRCHSQVLNSNSAGPVHLLSLMSLSMKRDNKQRFTVSLTGVLHLCRSVLVLLRNKAAGVTGGCCAFKPPLCVLLVEWLPFSFLLCAIMFIMFIMFFGLCWLTLWPLPFCVQVWGYRWCWRMSMVWCRCRSVETGGADRKTNSPRRIKSSWRT